MDTITAEQAAEAAKGLTFEKVWAALMENRQQMQESQKETQKQMQETQKETQKQMQETQKETQKQMQETQKEIKESQKETQKQIQETQKQMKESQQKTDKILEELSKNIGGLGNSLGRLTETMFSAELWKKFNDLGYPFSKQGPHVKFIKDKKVLAEADFLLENGEYVMPVEVKTDLSTENINEHLQRIETIRRYFDASGDRRILVGAVAGGVVQDNVMKYAQKKGLYVIVQTGDSVTIADSPPDFKAREW